MPFTTATRPRSWSLQHLYSIVLLASVVSGQAYSVQYCSPDLNNDANELASIYMSNGKCQQNCLGSYVYAIVQGQNCWCSNDVPTDQVDLSQCNFPCPGWQQDMCGSPDNKLYGYINIGGIPSGTSGGSASAPQSTSSLSSSSKPTASPSTYVTTVTGKASTVVVTSSPTGTDSALGSGVQAVSHSSGLNGGQVAGIVIGCALGIGLLIGLIVFLWLRHKHRKNLTAMSENGSYTSPSSIGKSGNGGIPSRQVSQMSSAGLLTRPTRMNTGGFSNPDDPRSVGGNGSLTDRSSTHLAVDQRLNPWAIYSNDESRQSNVSLQDNQDYSRQLRVANPDP